MTTPDGPVRGGARMRLAYSEMLDPAMMRLAVGVVLGLLAIFVISGPAGTNQTLIWIERLAYWGLCGVLDLIICYGAGVLALYLTRSRPPLQIALGFAVTALILAAPCAAITYTGYGLFHDGRPPDVDLPRIYGVSALVLLAVAAHLYYVLYLRVRLAALDEAAPSVPSDNGSPVPPWARPERVVAPPENRFLDRLPGVVGRDLVCLKMAGRYVEAVTTGGSDIVRMRLADAVTELRGLGMQVHRSHWVALHHVTRLLRRDGREFLKLTDGHEVPVGRTYLRAVREAVPKKMQVPSRYRSR